MEAGHAEKEGGSLLRVGYPSKGMTISTIPCHILMGFCLERDGG